MIMIFSFIAIISPFNNLKYKNIYKYMKYNDIEATYPTILYGYEL